MAKTQTRTVLLTSQTKSAATPLREAWDVSALDVGVLTLAITNGPTGPTGQAIGRVLMAHKQGSMPAASAPGPGDNAWKTVYEFAGGTVAGVRTDRNFTFGPEYAYLAVEFPTHTGTDVTIEAIGTGTVN